MPYSVTTTANDRPVWPAMKRGLACKCPQCGEGKLYRAYLKTVDTCDHCGLDISQHRADDLPPYLAIMVVGHLLVGIMIHMDMVWHIAPMNYLAVMLPLAIVLPVAMLPATKGVVVALQWALRMHGFGTGPDPAEPETRS